MKMSIQCPHCKRRARTLLTFFLKGAATYSIYSDYFGPLRFIRARYNYPDFKDVLKNKSILGFGCVSCKKEYPQSMFEEIIEYIKSRSVYEKIKRKALS